MLLASEFFADRHLFELEADPNGLPRENRKYLDTHSVCWRILAVDGPYGMNLAYETQSDIGVSITNNIQRVMAGSDVGLSFNREPSRV